MPFAHLTTLSAPATMAYISREYMRRVAPIRAAPKMIGNRLLFFSAAQDIFGAAASRGRLAAAKACAHRLSRKIMGDFRHILPAISRAMHDSSRPLSRFSLFHY